MRIRALTFFLLMTSIVGISNAATMPAPIKVLPRPVLFIDYDKLYDSLFELIELNKKTNALCEQYNTSGNPGSLSEDPEFKILTAERNELQTKRLPSISATIAKRLGACAVLTSQREISIYVDPAYDITQEVVDALNQEYLKLHAKKPVLKQPPQDLLHNAILKNSAEGIKQAVQAGANIHYEKDGKSPLGWAVSYKKYNAVKSLLECGDQASSTLFQEALKLNDIKSAVLLAINCGANLNATYSNGYQNGTLLQFSASLNYFESMLLLIESGANYSGYTIVTDASDQSIKFTLMEPLVRYGSDGIAFKLIQKALNNGYNVNDIWRIGTKMTLSSSGSWYLSEHIIKLIIENGANPNQFFETNYLLSSDWGGGIPGSSWTPLFSAISRGSKGAVEILLNAGADINKKANPFPNQPPLCPNGPQTPLSFAINKGQVQIAELLKQYGATL